MPTERLLDAAAAAEMLGISERQMRELRARREMPVVRVGRRLIRYRVSDLIRYIEAHYEPALRGPLADR